MKKISVWLFAALMSFSLLAMSNTAHAATTPTRVVVLKPGDFISALSDTRSAGHVEFLRNSLHVFTDDSTSNAKAAEYWSADADALPSKVTFGWMTTPSAPEPGSQIVFSVRQETPSHIYTDNYNILVGEKVYGNDFWLTNGSGPLAHSVCPQTGGGFGSACHGTLAEWKSSLAAAGMTVHVYAYGFSLGSGVFGNGEITKFVADDTTYKFTNAADSVGTATIAKVNKPRRIIAKVTLSTAPLAADRTQGAPVRWKVISDNKKVASSSMRSDQSSVFRVRFAKHTGAHVVQVFANGVLAKSRTFHTGH